MMQVSASGQEDGVQGAAQGLSWCEIWVTFYGGFAMVSRFNFRSKFSVCATASAETINTVAESMICEWCGGLSSLAPAS